MDIYMEISHTWTTHKKNCKMWCELPLNMCIKYSTLEKFSFSTIKALGCQAPHFGPNTRAKMNWWDMINKSSQKILVLGQEGVPWEFTLFFFDSYWTWETQCHRVHQPRCHWVLLDFCTLEFSPHKEILFLILFSCFCSHSCSCEHTHNASWWSC